MKESRCGASRPLAAAGSRRTPWSNKADEERLPVAARVLGSSSLLHRRNFQAQPGTASIYQLDINYRQSSLSLDARAMRGELRAGERAPDALLPDGRRLFDVLRGTYFTLLAFAVVLIRPDCYIAAIGECPLSIDEYLKRWTGAGLGAQG
jgi:hypothetical protein